MWDSASITTLYFRGTLISLLFSLLPVVFGFHDLSDVLLAISGTHPALGTGEDGNLAVLR